MRNQMKEFINYHLGLTNDKLKSFPYENNYISEVMINLMDNNNLTLLRLKKELIKHPKLSGYKEADLKEVIDTATITFGMIFVKTYREFTKLKQSELANHLDWSTRQISYIESGSRAIQHQTFLAMGLLLFMNSDHKQPIQDYLSETGIYFYSKEVN